MRDFTRSTAVFKMNTSIECDVEIFAVQTRARCVLCGVWAATICEVNGIYLHSSYSKTAPGPLVPVTASHPACHPGLFPSLPSATFWKWHHWSIVINFTKIWSWTAPEARRVIHRHLVREYPALTEERRAVLIRRNWKRDFHRSGIPDASSFSLESKHNNLLFCKLRRMTKESYNISNVRVLKIYFTFSDCLFKTLLLSPHIITHIYETAVNIRSDDCVCEVHYR
jgi:hypothetical protein